MLDGTLTAAEVAYQSGFGSPSYFNKCFHDQYGFPPGEVHRQNIKTVDISPDQDLETLIDDLGKPELQAPFESHLLAAIMFTDIQGYTALMQRDELKAIEFRNRHREVFNAVTEKFRGKILQYYGDGTLSTFSSAIDAVRCGIEMQLAFQEEPQIPVRIGIHTGDIMVTKDDIIGDGVNVASRIESLAAAGSVFISEKVYDEVKNQSGIQTTSMGVFELKNVDKPIEVFAIANAGLVVPELEKLTGAVNNDSPSILEEFKAKGKRVGIKWAFIILAAISLGYLVYSVDISEITFPTSDLAIAEKSIAVLPFIDDSNDSTNVYIINGLMESVLNNLQKIGDLRVVSRTSTEKYRNTVKRIPEIGKELEVNYFVEGSGQKIGNKILLNVQLIEASTDKHLWSEQYDREADDIFDLQKEVAKNIADKIQAIITPEEEERIDKVPTDDLVAYDFFLKGLDLFYKGSREGLEEAITYFKKALEHDNKFARAYANIAIAYYFLDIFQTEKKYSVEINNYADKALLYDSQLPQSLVAKALFYIQNGEYELALPHLEKALEYDPNSAMVINILSDFHARFIPNTEKYLEYALKGIRLDIASNDSTTASFIYLHVSNAFIQTGFVDEAEKYISKSLEYDPENLYSEQLKAYILFARHGDLQQTKELLLHALSRDTTRLDIMQEVGKISYFMRDYESAYHYYKKFAEIREALDLDIYRVENSKIGMVMSKMGQTVEAEKYFQDFQDYAENDQSIYKHINMAMGYVIDGDTQKAIDHLKLFSEQENYHYWIILFFEMDPLMDEIKNLPEFKKIHRDIVNNFGNRQKEIRASLEERGLI